MTGNEQHKHATRPFLRSVGRVILTGSFILLACLLAVVGVLLRVLVRWSPGKPKPFVDENGRPLPGSISEKIHVNINGVQQGMFIQSKDEKNPVLLFLHGGPGMPDYFLTQRYPTGLEDYFTVCWWEQRGSGLSYSPDIAPESITVEQLISDTLEVANYLRRRFGKEKLYLLGISWGSIIGIQAAARAPELFHAYIGVAQVAYQLKSEKLAYEYMLEQFKARGNRRLIRIFEQAPVTMAGPLPHSYDAVRDEAMHTLGIGTTHDMKSVITGIFFPVWSCPEYTLREKVNIWRGKLFSKGILWHKFMATDLTERVTELELPVYICQGIYDYTTNYALARSYFDIIKAPVKGFYTFEQSAHSPVFEEPERMRRIMQEDVLAGANNLADASERISFAQSPISVH